MIDKTSKTNLNINSLGNFLSMREVFSSTTNSDKLLAIDTFVFGTRRNNNFFRRFAERNWSNGRRTESSLFTVKTPIVDVLLYPSIRWWFNLSAVDEDVSLDESAPVFVVVNVLFEFWLVVCWLTLRLRKVRIAAMIRE